MLTELFFYCIIGIVVGSFLLNLILDILNVTALKLVMPSALTSFYPIEKYKESVRYFRQKYSVELFEAIFSFLLTLAVLYFGWFGWLNRVISSCTTNEYLSLLLFFSAIFVLMTLVNLPISFYNTFVVEAKFGFNNMSVATFFGDALKSLLLAIVFGGVLFLFGTWLWLQFGTYFWVGLWAGITIVSLIITLFYSNLIVPLFNKQTPLEEGDLKSAITDFAATAGFKVHNIFVINGSKRSTKANAYFTGFGPKKRIVLYDTLIEKFDNEEIVAVLAHEVGHYKKRHVLKSSLFSILQNGIMFYLLSLFIDPSSPISLALSQAVTGMDVTTDFSLQLGIVGFALVYSPILMLSGAIGAVMSRKHEFQADAFVKPLGLAQPLVHALEKLSVDSLSNMTPHPWYVFMHYSHPPTLKRISALKK